MTMLSLYVSCAKRPSSTTFSSAGGGEEGYKCGIKSGVDVTPGDGSEPEAARGGQAEQILPLVNHKGIVPATKRVKEVETKGPVRFRTAGEVAAALLTTLAKHTGEPTFAALEMHFHVENKN